MTYRPKSLPEDPPLVGDRLPPLSFCQSQPPHKSVNLSFTATEIKNKLTICVGNDIYKPLQKRFL